MKNNNTVLDVEELRLQFGGLTALSGISFQVRQGEILGIIGPNGAGKTCILNCINRFYVPNEGEIYFEGKPLSRYKTSQISKIGIARTFQNIELYTGMTTLDNLMAARQALFKTNIFSDALYFGSSQRRDIRHREMVEDIIDFLEMEPIRNKVVGILPYGLRKRVELGRALALEPKLLLLDEPMAGMTSDEKEDMARFIIDTYERKGVNMILIEHDMGVVMDITDRLVVMDFGKKIAEGSPSEIKENPRVIEAYLGGEVVTREQRT